jgi:flagellar FliL protein
LHLREDLNERARLRSGGKVRELVIQSLVLE